MVDAELVELAHRFFRGGRSSSGVVAHLELDRAMRTCRPGYRAALIAYFSQHQDRLTDDSRRRLSVNPLRVLDDKELAPDLAEGAPRSADYLCDPCREHFLGRAEAAGRDGRRYVVDHRLVRGLDYYTRTTFEFFVAGSEGQQQALGAGGRYDGLAELLGGRSTPGIGFGIGFDRTVLAMGEKPNRRRRRYLVVAVVGTGDDHGDRLRVASLLRDAGLAVRTDGSTRKLGKQLESAAKAGAAHAVIVGEELAGGSVMVKALGTGEQSTVPLADLVEAVRPGRYDAAPMSTSLRSHTCGELRAEHVGERVTLSGWVHRRRDHGHLAFFDLRDRYGITQVVTSADDAPDAQAAAETARSEWVVQVEGIVRARPAGTANAELQTGAIEVAVDRFTVLNPSKVPPFYINEEQDGLDESLRLEHRYLDLRRPPLQERILLRARLSGAIRRALEDDGFVDIETPTLIRSTPEGARDFVVPSRLQSGRFYALPQSPQVLKQLLMVAGYDRYYQLAHAYRDEDLRGDRQPEHTQVDIEMSFVAEEDVISTVERVVTRVARGGPSERPILPSRSRA